MPPTREVRLSKACSYCKDKKIKCDGSLPCGNCIDRNNRCVYPPKVRRLRKKSSNEALQSARRQSTSTTLIESTHGALECESSPAGSTRATESIRTDNSQPSASMMVFSLVDPALTTINTERSNDQTQGRIPSPIYSQTSQCKSPPIDNFPNNTVQYGELPTPRDSEVDREEATIDLQNVNWQHHGPGSWLSICSEPGIRWVSAKIGSLEFCNIAKDLTYDWTKHLTLSQHPIRDRGPEIDQETSSKYVRAYFEYSPESVFGVVHRPQFENDLYRRFQMADWQEEDVASYALRNAVYAVGCRASAVMEASENFGEVQEQSLQYFFNSFSVLSTLLYMPSGLEAVQALVVMVSYAELLGSPSVEYMISAAATRLAQSKGLHRQPAKSWQLSSQEVLQRNWTFWAVYCHDKYLALRSGRPSAIDDDDISCEIPTEAPIGSTIDVQVCTASVKHAQICAEMMKRLFSAKSLTNSREALLQEMQALDNKLEQWRTSLPPNLFPSSPFLAHNPGSYRTQAGVTRLHRAYYGSVLALHCNINYPWICPRLANPADITSGDPLATSATRAAEAARQILRSLQHGPPDLGSSMPVAFYYPMLAIINLFIYVLKYPGSANAQSDLALLDIGSGHFGKIHYMTSAHVSFRFPREVVRIADTMVQRANTGAKSNDIGLAAKSAADFVDVSMSDGGALMNISTNELLDSDINSDHWSCLSTNFFEELSAGDMIIL